MIIVSRTRRVIIVRTSVPRIIDYSIVLERLTAQGLVSLYHNSGAFGFPRDVKVHHVGWIGADDSTLHPAARDVAIRIPPPYEPNLARLLVSFWREQLADAFAWLMPMSHWFYELDFGGATWMPQMLRDIGIDPEELRPRNNGAAIEHSRDESPQLETCVRRLLGSLTMSDFAVVFPRRPVVCTLHHHKQLWWATSDPILAKALRIVPSPGIPGEG